MLLNRIYYLLKPIVPWRLRMWLRRVRANRRKQAFAEVWPIDARAGTAPAGWPGWPDGKRFAFVLTHDVEGPKGVSRVEQLMQLEIRNGFRSCFNFVPEGSYRVGDGLRATLNQAGFEVGVHGLEHDGKLYSSKENFFGRAQRINEYLRHWKATGFRSPLMQHKLSWLHALDVDYDTSTFDTDPFEPEPDGMGTIFPFWVPGANGGGYVELPYTLVQDFTLFRVLQEKNIDIWKRKLDWVVEQGGMALLNTHPDYMSFNGIRDSDEFPVEYYEEFLQYVREKYRGLVWEALPSEVSQYYRENIPPSARNTRKKICMIAYTAYESDNRVRRYAETLAKRGDHVDIIALNSANGREAVEELEGVTVYRVQGREFNERGKLTYLYRLLRFLWTSSATLTKLHDRNRYDVIHVHNMPDFLVFAAWYPKMHGAKLILDIHDIVPEFFATKFKTSMKSAYQAGLKAIEKLSVGFVDHVIVSNHLWRETLVQRAVPSDRCSVLVNHVDPAMFYRHERTRTDDKFIVIFPGSYQWHQGLDIAIRAFQRFKESIPSAEFHLYGGAGGDKEGELKELAKELGLSESVKFFGGLPLDRIAGIIANADLGVVPKRADSFGNEAYSTKIMEFMSQGIPVVVSRTKIDTFYFTEDDVRFFPSGDFEAMAAAMLEVATTPALRKSLSQHGYEYVERNGWAEKKKEYLDLIDLLSAESFINVQPTSIAPEAQRT